jgi:hypothetical protein
MALAEEASEEMKRVTLCYSGDMVRAAAAALRYER